MEKLLITLHAAWRDVIENPRDDGVPSPQLQPDEFKKYMAEHTQDDQQGGKNGQAEKAKTRQELKIRA